MYGNDNKMLFAVISGLDLRVSSTFNGPYIPIPFYPATNGLPTKPLMYHWSFRINTSKRSINNVLYITCPKNAMPLWMLINIDWLRVTGAS